MTNPHSDRPWLAHYEPGVPHEPPRGDSLFHSVLDAAAASAPGYPALSFFGRHTTYAELDAVADRVAEALARDGLAPGRVVASCLPACPNLVALAFGAWRAGAVLAPLDPGLGAEELARVVARLDPHTLVVAPRQCPAALAPDALWRGRLVVARPARSLPVLARWLHRLTTRPARSRPARAASDWTGWLAPGDALPPDVELGPDAPALLAGAGTEGETVFEHRHLSAGAAMLRAWLPDAVSGDETWLAAAPLWSPFGLVVALGAAIDLHARVVLLPAPEPGAVLDAVAYLRPAIVALDGRLASELAAAPALARVDLAPVRTWLTGDVLAGATVRAFEEAAGVALCLGYAPSGAAGLLTCNPVNGRQVAGSVGLPLPGGAARILGESGQPLEAGASGLLEIEGPNVAAPDGRCRPGVSARIDEDGFVLVVDGAPPA